MLQMYYLETYIAIQDGVKMAAKKQNRIFTCIVIIVSNWLIQVHLLLLLYVINVLLSSLNFYYVPQHL